MSFNLPYIAIDEDLYLNTAIMTLILNKLSRNTRGNLKLDLPKIQVFMFLIKHPSHINAILEATGKSSPDLKQYSTYTMDSLAINVDELFNIKKTRLLLRKLAHLNLLSAVDDPKNGLSFHLTEDGLKLASEFTEAHFESVNIYIEALTPLLSITSSKLHSALNSIFKDK
ncbi:hypothetical protein FM038_014635 [Shewanella eurypsychrophilus]|uniref:HTH marR-type domain-containing protein n=1 Tax=Shewanella eurypsychrophilus TaxID=2593656 RepID=A0ABX6V9L6_9GAMM|nr:MULTISPECIES: ABC-three component system middle component 4 [Shewanella]QFU23296.1 hypothetical protein FS418_16455 [Shewanella sp. YLB-09]QPG58525.1 hypothetical protein FM038_014635 [Shewanella eurypsychrophilus]